MPGFRVSCIRNNFCYFQPVPCNFGHISKRRQRSQVAGDAAAVDKKRDVLAGMVGGRGSGVVAVVGGQDKQVVGAQMLHDAGQRGVKVF